MKSLNIILAMLITLSIYSCTNDNEEVLYDFSGTYEGMALCTHTEDGLSSEETLLVIEKTGDLSYTILFEDDLVFSATQAGDVLTIARQTHNEGGQFDVVTLEGIVLKTSEGITLETSHMVDDEGETVCTIPMTKQ